MTSSTMVAGGCRAILQGTMVAGRAARQYYRAPWWLGGLKSHTTGHNGSWEGCRAILQGTVMAGSTMVAGGCRAILQGNMVAGRTAGPYHRAPWYL